MHVVILAGGLATRMRPHTETIPKALLPVAGRPFVDVQLERLYDAGVRDVVFSIGHRGEQIEEHVGNGARHGLSVKYVSDGDRLLGTGGAVRKVVEAGLVPENFGVLNGDSFLTLDIPAIEGAFARSGKPALMTVMRNHDKWDRSNVVFHDDVVEVYDKRATEELHRRMEWIDYGFIVIRSDVVRERIPLDTEYDLSTLLHELSLSGDLAGFEVTERFYEIGSPEGLQSLEEVLRSGTRG